MKVLDLFSGIGGFSLGLERSGMETIAFCEIDKHCREVLKKHWPGVLKFKDIKDLSPQNGGYDVICGGFPCQDISVGGKQKGLRGERSGLWGEYKRVINEVRPKYAIIENVERLRKNGLGVVLRDLSEIGYNAEWHCITARSIGLPHQRDRVWIIAYPCGERQYEHHGEGRHLQTDKKWEGAKVHQNRKQCELKPGEVRTILSRRTIESIRNAYANEFATVSRVRRVVNGVSEGLDEKERKQRIKQLGNSVIPQIPEMIGRAIMEYEEELTGVKE